MISYLNHFCAALKSVLFADLIKASVTLHRGNLSFNLIFKFLQFLKLETLFTEISLPSLTDVEDRIWEEGPSLEQAEWFARAFVSFTLVEDTVCSDYRPCMLIRTIRTSRLHSCENLVNLPNQPRFWKAYVCLLIQYIFLRAPTV